MSSVNGERLNNYNSSSIIKVKAITLEKILDQYLEDGIIIDILSLDTEGYELNILNGLNLSKYRPRYILAEIYLYDLDKITELLQKNMYSLHSNFTNYNLSDNPHWDGTHNDYLFICKN
jgi:hypothetical protein